MIKIVKNKGQCKSEELRNCKVLLYNNDLGADMYAKVRLKPLIGYFKAKLRGDF